MSVEATKDSLRSRGVRLTRQRKILLDLIDGSGEHLDAEQLYQLAKEKDPKLNRVTVSHAQAFEIGRVGGRAGPDAP